MDLRRLKIGLSIKKSLLALYKRDSINSDSDSGRKQAQNLFIITSDRIAQIEEEIRIFEN